MTFRHRLAEPARRLNGHVCVIPSAVVTQAIAAAGADFVIIDQEHAPASLETVHAMIAATQGTDCAPFVRVPEIAEAPVKQALDMGAEGICFPLVRSAADAARAVKTLRYPPAGRRGWGPFIAHSRWGTSLFDYASTASDAIVCMLLIETRDAVADIEAIIATPGIDCIVIAGFDLSTDLGVSGQFDHPDFLAATARIEVAALSARMPMGTSGLDRRQTEAAIARGHRLIAGFDILWLKQSVAQSVAWTAEAP